jgi:hypothetical protein
MASLRGAGKPCTYPTREDHGDSALGYSREAEEFAVVDTTKGTGDEGKQNCRRHLKYSTVCLGHGSNDELEQAKKTAQGKDDGHVDETRLEEDGDSSTGQAVHDNAQPDIVAVLCVDNLVQARQGFIETNDVVQDLLVDFVRILELAQIDALGSADDLDFGSARAMLARWGMAWRIGTH